MVSKRRLSKSEDKESLTEDASSKYLVVCCFISGNTQIDKVPSFKCWESSRLNGRAHRI